MKLIKLEIAIDYPIQWEFRLIYRDLIQNFYDAIGPEDFEKRFIYTYKEVDGKYDIVMAVKGITFSYEWLTYIGGSTKTESKSQNIGKYGEGFKMSALGIMQMDGIELSMHSQNWTISPTTYTEVIDNKNITMLGYSYEEAEDDNCSKLELRGVPAKYIKELEECLLDFYYPGNKLFGDFIGRGECWEIYHRSEMPIPCRQYAPDLLGILYINNLARGRLDFPVIINYKTTSFYDSRSRPTFDERDTIRQVNRVCRRLDGETSYTLLNILSKYWNSYPKGIRDINTKYFIICQLVRNIFKDDKWREIASKEFNKFVYIERKKSDHIRNKLIDETIIWAKDVKENKLVNPVFRLLGAKSLVEEYILEKNKMYVQPSDLEYNRYKIIYAAVLETVPIYLTDRLPELIINTNESKRHNALQYARRNTSRRKGEKFKRYIIDKVVFNAEDFSDNHFKKTFIKLAEILLHTYGTDRSSMLTTLLTNLGNWTLKNREKIDEYERLWLHAVNGTDV